MNHYDEQTRSSNNRQDESSSQSRNRLYDEESAYRGNSGSNSGGSEYSRQRGSLGSSAAHQAAMNI